MRSVRPVCVALVLVLALWSPGYAQEGTGPVVITLYPAPAAAPGPEQRLLPEYSDVRPGNAAVAYGKVKAENNRFFGEVRLAERMERIHDTPLADLLRERPAIGLGDHFLEEAACCETCDWQLPLRREPLSNFLIPEASECRGFGRILAAKARMAIAERDYSTAINRMRWTYALARHSAAGETIVHGALGGIIASYASKQMLTLVQQPTPPNLYWSLARLPRPFIDMRRTLEAFGGQWELGLPELRRPELSGRSEQQWEETLHHMWTGVGEFADNDAWKRGPEELVKQSLARHEAVRSELISQGWPAWQIKDMPAAQVVLLSTVNQSRDVENAAFAAFFLPYPQAMQHLTEAQEKLKQLRDASKWALPIGPFHLDAMVSARSFVARVDRELAVLQFLEALRAYAAREGRLPERLPDLTDLPVPNDPVTDRPFRYFTDGNVARLAGPPLGDQPLDYEVRLGKSNE